MTQHLGNIFQALTLAAIIWTGSSIVKVSEAVAIHDWRINALEQKVK